MTEAKNQVYDMRHGGEHKHIGAKDLYREWVPVSRKLLADQSGRSSGSMISFINAIDVANLTMEI